MPQGIAKLHSICPVCQGAINPNDAIVWGKSTKARHPACAGFANNPANVPMQTNIPSQINVHVAPHIAEAETDLDNDNDAAEIDHDVLERFPELAAALKSARETLEAEKAERAEAERKAEAQKQAEYRERELELEREREAQHELELTPAATPAVIDGAHVAVNDSIDLSNLEEYMPQNGEVDDLTAALKQGLNCALRGPAGCGKTHLVHYVAKLLGAKLYEIVGDGGIQREDVIGMRAYNGKETYWVDGIATRALRAAQSSFVILYVDEPNRLRDDVQACLFPIMDYRRRVVLPENNGEIVTASVPTNCNAGIVTISSWNDGYRGTNTLDEAYNDRYEVGVTLDYLPAAREIKLLIKRTGVNADAANAIVGVATELRRAQAEKQIQTPISTRSLLAYALMVKGGNDLRSAGELTIVGKVSSTLDLERKTIRDMIHAKTEGSVIA